MTALVPVWWVILAELAAVALGLLLPALLFRVVLRDCGTCGAPRVAHLWPLVGCPAVRVWLGLHSPSWAMLGRCRCRRCRR